MSKPQYQNSQYTRVMNLKYKSKYKRLKRQIKNFVFENAALCDEVAQVQADLAIAREERRYLIKRLMRHEGVENLDQQEQIEQEVNMQPTKNTVKLGNAVPKKRGPKKRLQPPHGQEKIDKRYKPRDKVTLDSSGKPMYPINLCNILVHSPGEIIPINPNFHTSNWIYPVGYVATRIYAHPKDPQRKCVYTCKILNNAGMPQFQIIPDNDLDSVFFGESANICHKGLLETLQCSLIDVVQLPLQVQGEKFFGLANPTVKTLLQMDPGFSQCANFKGFIEDTDTNGSEKLSLLEDKDPTMSFDALQTLIAVSTYHNMPEVKDEPPDELLDFK
ncbi:PREDICTED: transforming growth factor beta regulator 1 [Rhagoletis zephyria]|uniref:transforming growth factor beta regulator 1 n=1 Tax=Rhagoletis zephyria TaxID=28612 RepID=UPI0008112CF7|nr:PREDICTED: transforming growth factor beta regulator 1 [Rhagoletis zephyria]